MKSNLKRAGVAAFGLVSYGVTIAVLGLTRPAQAKPNPLVTCCITTSCYVGAPGQIGMIETYQDGSSSCVPNGQGACTVVRCN